MTDQNFSIQPKVLIKKNEFNVIFALLVGLMIIRGVLGFGRITATISLTLAVLGIIYLVLLAFNPLLVQQYDKLIIKPNIPFETKKLAIRDVAGIRQAKGQILEFVLKNGKVYKVPLVTLNKEEQKGLIDYLASLTKPDNT